MGRKSWFKLFRPIGRVRQLVYDNFISFGSSCQGRRPRETGGTVPSKFEVGDGPSIRPPDILRSSVVGCAQKYEQSKEKV